MNLEDIHSVYFIGIGGIGMSAIARWFNNRGAVIGGYDRVQTPLTTVLEEEGMWVHYEDYLSDIPEAFLEKQGTLIVYTPAVPKTHNELNYFQNEGYVVKKRSEVLGIISKDHYTVAVGGTHGKTTTSSMVAHLLNNSAKGCSAFIGGIMTNYNSNLIMAGKRAPIVAEADEFDRSFLQLFPNYAIISSVDPDHLDIYGNEEEMKKGFGDFIGKVDKEGKVIIHHKAAGKIGGQINRYYRTYGINEGDIQARMVRPKGASFIFNYHGISEIRDVKLAVPGFHNVENAVAAITVALDLGMEPEAIKRTVESYRGVKRRFEFILKNEKLVFIDDYAHHPTEIRAFLESVKALYPAKKLTAVFQPHLYTRTRDFQDDFAKSLSIADEVVLLDIYPAREAAMPGITSRIIMDKIENENKILCNKDALFGVLNSRQVELLCTIGAGDIDQLVPKLKENYIKEYKIEA